MAFRNLEAGFALGAILLTTPLVSGCATTSTPVNDVSLKENQSQIIYTHNFKDNKGKTTSKISADFNGEIYKLVIEGVDHTLKGTRVVILFDEDIDIAHSKTKRLFKSNEKWYELKKGELTKAQKIGRNIVERPPIPFGIGTGIGLFKTLVKRDYHPIDINGLQNEYDPVELSFTEKSIQGAAIYIPLSKLMPRKQYRAIIMAEFNDGLERIINEPFYLKIN